MNCFNIPKAAPIPMAGAVTVISNLVVPVAQAGVPVAPAMALAGVPVAPAMAHAGVPVAPVMAHAGVPVAPAMAHAHARAAVPIAAPMTAVAPVVGMATAPAADTGQKPSLC
jgi:hypothetical protein